MSVNKKHFVICGASPDTGNLGVSALGNGAVVGFSMLENSPAISVLDSGSGLREGKYPDGQNGVDVTLCGARYSRKFYLNDSFTNISLCSRLGLTVNPVANHLNSASAFLDISGGDSFTDLYGRFRFEYVNVAKQYALKNDIPLVLMPQTYGPFKDSAVREIATDIIQRSQVAVARDKYSFNILKELLGRHYDPNRHMRGVDMAFLLPCVENRKKINPDVLRLIDSTEPVIGINVNGLIFNDSESAVSRYGFICNYNAVLQELINVLVEKTKYNIVLIPHVIAALDSKESDRNANQSLYDSLTEEKRNRVFIQDDNLDQCEVKWLISQMDWFMGTRMHATIAALSTCTPVCTISYSDKALGVFSTCDQEQAVFDPRRLNSKEILDRLITSLHQKELIEAELKYIVPSVIDTAKSQLAFILENVG